MCSKQSLNAKSKQDEVVEWKNLKNKFLNCRSLGCLLLVPEHIRTSPVRSFLSVSVAVSFYQSIRFLFLGVGLIPLQLIPECTSSGSVLLETVILSYQCTTTYVPVHFSPFHMSTTLMPPCCCYSGAAAASAAWSCIKSLVYQMFRLLCKCKPLKLIGMCRFLSFQRKIYIIFFS